MGRMYGKYIMIVTLAVCGVFSAAVLGWHQQHTHPVTLSIGGETRNILTTARTVAELLSEQGVVLGADDVINVAQNTPIVSQTTVVIQRSFPIAIHTAKERRVVYVTAMSVADVLAKHKVALGKDDRVTASRNARVRPYETIRIVRVRKVVTETKHVMPYRTVRQDDPHIPQGKEIVLQGGREGLVVKKIQYVYEDGKLVSTKKVASTVSKKQRDRRIAVGTKKVRPKIATDTVAILSAQPILLAEDFEASSTQDIGNDATINAKQGAKTSRPSGSVEENTSQERVSVQQESPPQQASSVAEEQPSAQKKGKWATIEGEAVPVLKVLEDVELSAYTANKESTGKRYGDPGHGITKTGTQVKEGRTIAVDPRVIPLGWWVHIEGIGLRRAEDIGTFVKGKEIDLYMKRTSQAKKFGRQDGHTVYVIGPRIPEQLKD